MAQSAARPVNPDDWSMTEDGRVSVSPAFRRRMETEPWENLFPQGEVRPETRKEREGREEAERQQEAQKHLQNAREAAAANLKKMLEDECPDVPGPDGERMLRYWQEFRPRMWALMQEVPETPQEWTTKATELFFDQDIKDVMSLTLAQHYAMYLENLAIEEGTRNVGPGRPQDYYDQAKIDNYLMEPEQEEMEEEPFLDDGSDEDETEQ